MASSVGLTQVKSLVLLPTGARGAAEEKAIDDEESTWTSRPDGPGRADGRTSAGNVEEYFIGSDNEGGSCQASSSPCTSDAAVQTSPRVFDRQLLPRPAPPDWRHVECRSGHPGYSKASFLIRFLGDVSSSRRISRSSGRSVIPAERRGAKFQVC